MFDLVCYTFQSYSTSASVLAPGVKDCLSELALCGRVQFSVFSPTVLSIKVKSCMLDAHIHGRKREREKKQSVSPPV